MYMYLYDYFVKLAHLLVVGVDRVRGTRK